MVSDRFQISAEADVAEVCATGDCQPLQVRELIGESDAREGFTLLERAVTYIPKMRAENRLLNRALLKSEGFHDFETVGEGQRRKAAELESPHSDDCELIGESDPREGGAPSNCQLS